MLWIWVMEKAVQLPNKPALGTPVPFLWWGNMAGGRSGVQILQPAAFFLQAPLMQKHTDLIGSVMLQLP